VDVWEEVETLLNLEVVAVALGWLAAAASLLVFAKLEGTHPADDEGHPRWVFNQTLRNVPRGSSRSTRRVKSGKRS
jgi:hypothetical protein